MSLKVFKFGGSLLNNIAGFKQIKKIIELNYAETNNFIIVVSAFEKTTSKLLKAAMCAEIEGEKNAMPIINNIIQYHIGIVDALFKSNSKNRNCKYYIQEQNIRLINYIKGVALTRELSPRTKDLILSIGEMLASFIVNEYLVQYFEKALPFDITSVLITDNNYGIAAPDLKLTEKNIKEILLPLFTNTNILVTQGFIGSTILGEITTMGYESSNLTATILAAFTNSVELVIWTDVEGIRQYDPKLFPNAKPKILNRINYDFAEYLGYSGLKMIYPKMIELLRQFDLEVIYKSGLVPDGEYTIIGKEGNINECTIMIHSDNLITYSKSNIMNHFDPDCFPTMAHFLHYHNNTVIISPEEHLFVSNENIPIYVEEDLLAMNLHKRKNICSLAIINFNYLHFLSVMNKLGKEAEEQIINVLVNHQRKTVNILYQPNKKNSKKNALLKCFIDNYDFIEK